MWAERALLVGLFIASWGIPLDATRRRTRRSGPLSSCAKFAPPASSVRAPGHTRFSCAALGIRPVTRRSVPCSSDSFASSIVQRLARWFGLFGPRGATSPRRLASSLHGSCSKHVLLNWPAHGARRISCSRTSLAIRLVSLRSAPWSSPIFAFAAALRYGAASFAQWLRRRRPLRAVSSLCASCWSAVAPSPGFTPSSRQSLAAAPASRPCALSGSCWLGSNAHAGGCASSSPPFGLFSSRRLRTFSWSQGASPPLAGSSFARRSGATARSTLRSGASVSSLFAFGVHSGPWFGSSVLSFMRWSLAMCAPYKSSSRGFGDARRHGCNFSSRSDGTPLRRHPSIRCWSRRSASGAVRPRTVSLSSPSFVLSSWWLAMCGRSLSYCVGFAASRLRSNPSSSGSLVVSRHLPRFGLPVFCWPPATSALQDGSAWAGRWDAMPHASHRSIPSASPRCAAQGCGVGRRAMSMS